MTNPVAHLTGLPGWRSGACLGCDGRVVAARDAHCLIGGSRDGSVVVAIDAEPLLSVATDVAQLYGRRDLYLLGVAHRACVPLARRRLEAQAVVVPEVLPQLVTEEETDPLPALHLPAEAGSCAFCGSVDTTDEHVFAKWVSRELTHHVPLQLTTEHGTRRVRTIDITAPVCKTCNTRWLSVLEHDVKPILGPMIRGEDRTLLPEQQRLVATWAVKTAFMFDLASVEPVIPVGFYHSLRQRRTAPSSHIVWLGAYLGSTKAVWAMHRPLHLGISGDEPANAFVTTFTAFRCVFQVVGHFTVGGATFNEGRPLSLGLWPIWPPRKDSIRWPRDGLAFSDETLEQLAASID